MPMARTPSTTACGKQLQWQPAATHPAAETDTRNPLAIMQHPSKPPSLADPMQAVESQTSTNAYCQTAHIKHALHAMQTRAAHPMLPVDHTSCISSNQHTTCTCAQAHTGTPRIPLQKHKPKHFTPSQPANKQSKPAGKASRQSQRASQQASGQASQPASKRAASRPANSTSNKLCAQHPRPTGLPTSMHNTQPKASPPHHTQLHPHPAACISKCCNVEKTPPATNNTPATTV